MSENVIFITVLGAICVFWYVQSEIKQKKIDKLHKTATDMTEKYYAAQATIKRLRNELKEIQK